MWWMIHNLNLFIFLNSLIYFNVDSFKIDQRILESSVYDLCSDMCHRLYPKESLKNEMSGSPQNACQRGCERVCRIQLVSEDSNFVASSHICQKDCLRVYAIPLEQFACNLGCFGRLVPHSSGIAPLGWYPPSSEDTEPDDVLLDPALRTQLKADGSPLPHLRIKTLPQHHLQSVEDLLYQQLMERESFLRDPSVASNRKFWYDYFVSRMVLAAAIMLSVMCALWLCLVPQQSKSSSPHCCQDQESALHKLGNGTTEPPNYSEVEFLQPSTPPSSPPPRYSDVVHNV